MAAEEASFISDGEAGGDKRQDTCFKALPAAYFTDTGVQDRDDKRRDTAAEGCRVYLCGLRAMIKDNMDAQELLS